MSTELLTTREAADRLKVGETWLANQARAGKVPHRRLGRTVRFSEDDLAAILDSAKSGAAETNTWGLTPRSASRRRRTAS